MQTAERHPSFFFILLLLLCFTTTVSSAVPRVAEGSASTVANNDSGSDPFARLQIIHNVVDAGPLDLYLDGNLWIDDHTYQTATSFMLVLHGMHRIDIVPGTAPDNSAPLRSDVLMFQAEMHYAFVFQGLSDDLQLVVRPNVLLASLNDDMQITFIQGSIDTGPVDIRLLDPNQANKIVDLLQNNFEYGQAGIYHSLSAQAYNIELLNDRGAIQFGVYWFNLLGFTGRSLVFLTSGTGRAPSGGLTVIAFTTDGEALHPTISTDTDEDADVPATFILHENYPNPFNPGTQIRYTLAETASVRLGIYDIRGRLVKTLVHNTQQAAGSYTTPWDGRNEEGASVASGTYFYRIMADGHVETRSMLLIK